MTTEAPPNPVDEMQLPTPFQSLSHEAGKLKEAIEQVDSQLIQATVQRNNLVLILDAINRRAEDLKPTEEQLELDLGDKSE